MAHRRQKRRFCLVGGLGLGPRRLLARQQAGPLLLGPLALGDLLGGNIDGNDLATRRTQRVPIGNPGTLLDLIGALACDFNPYDRFTRFHDRPNDLLDRICQCRHAVSDKAAKMILNRNAADLGETLVDL